MFHIRNICFFILMTSVVNHIVITTTPSEPCAANETIIICYGWTEAIK